MFRRNPSEKSETPHIERVVDIEGGVNTIRDDFDRAISRGDLPVMHALNGMTRIIESRQDFSVSSVRTRLKNIAMPSYEQLLVLHRGEQVSEELTEQLDAAYEHTGELIGQLFHKRAGLRTSESQLDGELTGAISESVIMALSNRNGPYSNLLTLPTEKYEDQAGFNSIGLNLGVDFRVYPIKNIHTFAKTQVKTTNSSKRPYAKDILVVSVQNLTGSAQEALFTLPRAIVNDARGESTPEERRLIGTSAMKLTQTVFAHLGLRPQKNELESSLIL